MREPVITLEIKVRQTIDYDVPIVDIIHSVNELDILKKWNCVASLLNSIDPKTDLLMREHKEIILNWLNKQIVKFT